MENNYQFIIDEIPDIHLNEFIEYMSSFTKKETLVTTWVVSLERDEGGNDPESRERQRGGVQVAFTNACNLHQ